MAKRDSIRLCSPWIKPQNSIWETVLQLGNKRTYKKGNIVAGNGEPIECLYFLYEGRLKLSRINAAGTEKVLWYLEKGNLFGEVPFWDRKPMENIFTASEKSIVYTFSRKCVQEDIAARYPALILNLLEGLANKARLFSMEASDNDSLISRVSKILIYVIAREHGDEASGYVRCRHGISQQELASILGVHRVTLNHAIAQLKKNGVIAEMSKNSLVINDYELLYKLAVMCTETSGFSGG